jgi:hypothetical protein
MIESVRKRLHREPDTHWLGIGLTAIGIAGLTYLAVKRTARRRQQDKPRPSLADTAEFSTSMDDRSVFRILTVKAHPANVEKDWEEFVSTQGSDESREATMTFSPAPGARGTEIRGELSWTPRGGKLGETVQRMRHKAPGQILGRDLKRFKMLVETGESVKSDASIHEHMHPARPSDTNANANVVREARR